VPTGERRIEQIVRGSKGGENGHLRREESISKKRTYKKKFPRGIGRTGEQVGEEIQKSGEYHRRGEVKKNSNQIKKGSCRYGEGVKKDSKKVCQPWLRGSVDPVQNTEKLGDEGKEKGPREEIDALQKDGKQERGRVICFGKVQVYGMSVK